MKFNPKQLDSMARVLGTLCSSSAIGLMIGVSRPESLTALEKHGLILAIVSSFSAMLLIL